MRTKTLAGTVMAVLALCLGAIAWGKTATASKQAPQKKAAWAHAPYEGGSCDLCHKSAEASAPGAVKKAEPELCLDCHEQFGARLNKYKHTHEATETCSACHNPHNGERALFLLGAGAALCLDCHNLDAAKHPRAKVASADRACVACHNPHGSDKKHLKQPAPK